MRKLASIVLQFSTAAVLMTGCTVFPKTSKLHSIKVKTTQENSDAFSNVDDLSARLSKLTKGMTEADAFKTLNVSPKKFRNVPDDEKMRYVDGPQVIAQPHTDEDLDKIKKRTDSYMVYELAYSNVVTKNGFGLLLTVETLTSGFDLKIQLTFKDGLFQKASVPGVQEINRFSKETILQVLTNAIRGGGQDGLQQVLKNAIITIKP
jgi:hypothetical protein